MENYRGGTFSFPDAATNSLAIEANGRHGIEILIKFESVQGGRLAGTVETEHRHVERSSRGKCLEQTAGRAASAHPSTHPSLLFLPLSRPRLLFVLNNSFSLALSLFYFVLIRPSI